MRIKRNFVAGLVLAAAALSENSGEAATFDSDTRVTDFCAAIESRLLQHRFDELDQLEQELRDPDVRLTGGNSQLYEYYGALGVFSGSSVYSCDSRLPFETKQQALEQWFSAKPASIAAHIALAQLWWAAAWRERGNDYASGVGFFQWIGFYADLRKANSILAQIDTGADAHARYLLLEIAQGEFSWFDDRRAKLDALYAAAVRAYPRYYHFYSQRAEDLQIRWHGQPGELAAYLNSLASVPGGEAGSVAYSFAAYKLEQATERSILLQTTGLSWPLIQLGYATRERLYGMRNRDWNALLNMALAGVDQDAAKAALVHIGDHWDPVIWQQKTYFDYAVAWTNKVRQ